MLSIVKVIEISLLWLSKLIELRIHQPDEHPCYRFKDNGGGCVQGTVYPKRLGCVPPAPIFLSGCNSVMHNMLQKDTTAVAKNIAL